MNSPSSPLKCTFLFIMTTLLITLVLTAPPPRSRNRQDTVRSGRSANGSDSASLSLDTTPHHGNKPIDISPHIATNGTSTTTTTTTTTSTTTTTTTEATPEAIDPAAEVTSTQDTSTFSCQGRITGYYADVKLGCRVYHFCTQVEGIDSVTYQRMSYICLEGSVFDQKDLNCVKEADLKIKCKDAERNYESSNKQFDSREESAPSMRDSLAANLMMNPITRFITG